MVGKWLGAHWCAIQPHRSLSPTVRLERLCRATRNSTRRCPGFAELSWFRSFFASPQSQVVPTTLTKYEECPAEFVARQLRSYQCFRLDRHEDEQNRRALHVLLDERSSPSQIHKAALRWKVRLSSLLSLLCRRLNVMCGGCRHCRGR